MFFLGDFLMFGRRVITAIIAIVIFVNGVGYCQNLETNWNDFLHYAMIGRLDLAEGYATSLIESDPDPLELLALSEENAQGYSILLKVHSNNKQLMEVSGIILDIIESGRYLRRTDPQIITQEIKRLSSTVRGRLVAIERLRNAGEYSIVYMLDAMADDSRAEEYPNIADALGKIGLGSIRPLVAALQIKDVGIKADIIKALGNTGYPQSLAYLKYVAENDESMELRQIATEVIDQIDPSANKVSSAELFYQLAGRYYYKAESLAPPAEVDFANIWFWDEQAGRIVREEVDKSYFNELMTMRACEWSLKADADMGKAISLWLASYFKVEQAGLILPDYFGSDHADAMTYATTAGPEYLHQGLARALKDKDAYVGLNVVEALAVSTGEKSLLYRVGSEQPLVDALSFEDKSVKYSAAIAIAQAGPDEAFPESILIIENLSDAISEAKNGDLSIELADSYALRSATAMLGLAVSGNRVVNLIQAQPELIEALGGKRIELRLIAVEILARLNSPDAQRAIAKMALDVSNDVGIRVAAFEALVVSAKLNSNFLTDDQIDTIYSLISSGSGDSELRSVAAAAYGALNLPSKKVKQLIIDQARS